MLAGGCYCGQVRYESDGAPFNETLCHCTDCRRVVGAHVVAWFTVPRDSLRWTGTPASFQSSPGVTRRFCANCGTSLTWEGKADEVDLSIASLDEPGSVAPQDHVYGASRV